MVDIHDKKVNNTKRNSQILSQKDPNLIEERTKLKEENSNIIQRAISQKEYYTFKYHNLN